MTTYSPKYITLNDVPVQVPDEYDDKEKLDAIEKAETSLEIDINNGESIADANFVSVMRSAIKQKATCELIKGASHPNDVRLGDIQEESGKQDLAETFCMSYEELVAKINEAGIIQSGQSTDPYTYTTVDQSHNTHGY